jgi:hypothetical protein
MGVISKFKWRHKQTLRPNPKCVSRRGTGGTAPRRKLANSGHNQFIAEYKALPAPSVKPALYPGGGVIDSEKSTGAISSQRQRRQ